MALAPIIMVALFLNWAGKKKRRRLRREQELQEYLDRPRYCTRCGQYKYQWQCPRCGAKT